MLVTDRLRGPERDLTRIVGRVARAGVGFVQVREKDLHDDELRALVREIREIVAPSTVVGVNGRVEVARSLGCGLHLPAADPMPARQGLPLVGRSAHDLDEVLRAAEEGVDYLVVGPIYPTPSKPGHPGWGLDLIRRAVARVEPIPVFAIGGVGPANVAEVVRAGAWGVAVIGAIVSASDPAAAAGDLAKALEDAAGEPSGGGRPAIQSGSD
jgi:thiamine-phosphate pyrophosphorylase